MLVLVASALLLAGTTSAQVILGGTIDFSASSTKSSEVTEDYEKLQKNPTDFSMGIAPKVGYVINDKVEVGLKLDLQYEQTMNYVSLYDEDGENPKSFKDYKQSDFSWAIQPYTRFRCVEANGFGLWIEGLVDLGSVAKTNIKYYAAEYGDDGDEWRSEKEAAKLNNAPEVGKTTNFTGGLYIQPVLTYAINEHIRLETSLNFLGFGISGTVNSFIDDEGNTTKSNTCNFGLNISPENVAQIGLISIGCVYAF